MFKISGYLKEIDPDSDELTRYSDKAYEFYQGTVEWEFEQTSNDGGTKCNYIYNVKGSGKDLISNLDVPYDTNGGKDGESNLVHLDTYDLKIKYNKIGRNGGPELALVGKLLIPVDYTQSVIVTKPSAHVNAICNGNTESTSVAMKDVAIMEFPITFLNLDMKYPILNGSLVAFEPSGNEWEGRVVSSDADVKFGGPVHVTPIFILGSEAPWGVYWHIELPYLQQDTDNDGLPDMNETIIGTDPKNPDTDNDGLLDGWEVNGVTKDGKVVVDLPSMGSHPLRKDLFLEIDWMKDAVHSHKPNASVIQRVVNAFNNKGIALHVDTGQWGGGNAVAHQEGSEWHKFDFDNDAERNAYLANNQYLFDIKKANFDRDRLGIFYYGIFVHEKPDTTGQAEMGGNFYVAMRENARVGAKAGTLMHEFGHTLQLGHGGRLENALQYDNTHFKPNYRSIMNYHFQFGGVPKKDASGKTTYLLDYSEEDLPDIEERLIMNEQAGLNWPSDPSLQSYYTCRDNGHGGLGVAADVLDASSTDPKNLKVIFTMDGSPVDWNCDGIIGVIAPTNVNGKDNDEYAIADGQLTLLEGRSDWDKIVLKIGCPGYGLSGLEDEEDVINVASEGLSCPEHLPVYASFGRKLDDRIPPEVPFRGEACDGEDNDNNSLVDEGCPDRDNDGVIDELDNCPDVANADQKDSDQDYIGDACMAQRFFKMPEREAQPPEEVPEEQAEAPPAETKGFEYKSSPLLEWSIIIGVFVLIVIIIIVVSKARSKKK
ncbi:MAG: hypothetical protein KJ574_02210, partial [Nanoarchaeota archaeon]|nr:hypothetical protein [Nanoarchaeota archaeon]